MSIRESTLRKLVVRALYKEWVSDPTPNTQNRWRNTSTGEYRYQEAKPGSREGAEEDEGSVSGEPAETAPEAVEKLEGEWEEVSGLPIYEAEEGMWVALGPTKAQIEQVDEEEEKLHLVVPASGRRTIVGANAVTAIFSEADEEVPDLDDVEGSGWVEVDHEIAVEDLQVGDRVKYLHPTSGNVYEGTIMQGERNGKVLIEADHGSKDILDAGSGVGATLEAVWGDEATDVLPSGHFEVGDVDPEDFYRGQSVRLLDAKSGEVVEGEVVEASDSNVLAEVGEYEVSLTREGRRFRPLSAEDFSTKSDGEKVDTLAGMFESLEVDGHRTSSVEHFQKLTREKLLPRVKAHDAIRQSLNRMTKVKQDGGRAYVRYFPASGLSELSLDDEEDYDTIAHEAAHWLLNGHGFRFGDNPNGNTTPHSLAWHHSGNVPEFNFNGDPDEWGEVTEFMLSSDDEDVVGFEEWAEEVDRFVASVETVDPEDLDHDAGAKTAEQLIEQGADGLRKLQPGDFINISSANRDGSEPRLYMVQGHPKVSETWTGDEVLSVWLGAHDDPDDEHHIYFHPETGEQMAMYQDEETEPRYVPLSEHPEGRDARPLLGAWINGEIGEARPVDPTDRPSSGGGSGGGGRPTRSEPSIDLTGLNPNPETDSDRMRNWASAVNRTWYKMARLTEEHGTDLGGRAKVASTYSMTNTHETAAMTHQVLQSEDPEYVKSHGNDLIDNYPWLIWAYMDVWEPGEAFLEEFGDLLEALGLL